MNPIAAIAVLLLLGAFVLSHFAEKGYRTRTGVAVWLMRLTIAGMILMFVYALFR